MKSLMAMAAGLLLLAPAMSAAQEFTEDYRLEECTFSDTGRNPYFSLNPGDQLILAGEDEGEELVVRITVLGDRQWITFETADGALLNVRTRVIEEREWIDDELAEVSRNFFARCTDTKDIFYFGEDVDIYEDGVIVSHDGQWRAGFDGALPGLIMPGTFLLGSRYLQEQAPGVALDRGEHIDMSLTIEVAAGEFADCVEVLETSALDPGDESTKIYCAGIGLVIDDEAELIAFDIDDDEDDDDDDDDNGDDDDEGCDDRRWIRRHRSGGR